MRSFNEFTMPLSEIAVYFSIHGWCHDFTPTRTSHLQWPDITLIQYICTVHVVPLILSLLSFQKPNLCTVSPGVVGGYSIHDHYWEVSPFFKSQKPSPLCTLLRQFRSVLNYNKEQHGTYPRRVTQVSSVLGGGGVSPPKTDPSKYRQNFEITAHPNTSVSQYN